MTDKRSDNDLVLIVMLMLALRDDDDPFVAENLYTRVRDRLRRADSWDPELDDLLRRSLHFGRRRSPRRFEEAREVAASMFEGFRRTIQESINDRISEVGGRLAELVANQNEIRSGLAQQQEEARLGRDLSLSLPASHSVTGLIHRSDAIKRHTVQLEAITLATILFLVIPYFQPAINQLLGPTVAFLIPFSFLAAVAWLAPVVNPEDRTRSRFKWGLTGLGAGATLGGGLAGALSLGIAAPVGALIGGATGFVAGFLGGPKLDGNNPVLTQGEARDYLMGKRIKYPDLGFQQVIDATEHPIKGSVVPIPMFTSDGVIKCAKEDVDAWLRGKRWR